MGLLKRPRQAIMLQKSPLNLHVLNPPTNLYLFPSITDHWLKFGAIEHLVCLHSISHYLSHCRKRGLHCFME